MNYVQWEPNHSLKQQATAVSACGTRIEETARLADLVENVVRRDIPASELENIIDNIGLPYSGINTTHAINGTIGPADADVMVSLRASTARPLATSGVCGWICQSNFLA